MYPTCTHMGSPVNTNDTFFTRTAVSNTVVLVSESIGLRTPVTQAGGASKYAVRNASTSVNHYRRKKKTRVSHSLGRQYEFKTSKRMEMFCFKPTKNVESQRGVDHDGRKSVLEGLLFL